MPSNKKNVPKPTRNPKKLPSQLKSEIDALRDSEKSLKSQISSKMSEGSRLVVDEIIDLLNLLVGQRLSGTRLKIIKKRSEKKWEFNISFDESSISSMPDVLTAISKIKEYTSASDGENVIEERR